MKGRNGLCLNFTFDLRCPEPSRIQRAAAKLKTQKTSRLRRAAKHLFAELVLARDTIEDTKHHSKSSGGFHILAFTINNSTRLDIVLEHGVALTG